MTDVVGLRFVSEGYDRLNAEIQAYQRGLASTTSAQAQAVSGSNAAAAAYLKQVQVYERTSAALNRVVEMQRDSARSAQAIVNAATGVTNTYSSAAASADFFVQALRKQEAETARVAAANQQFYRSLLQIDQPYRSAADSAEVFAQAQQRAGAAYDQLRASIDPTVAAQLKLARAQEIVNDAVRQGAIAPEQAADTMRRYTASLNDTSKANELLQRETQQLAAQYNPAMAAANALAQEQARLSRAMTLGVISADQYKARLTQLDAAYAAVQGNTSRTIHFINQFGDNARIAGLKTNRFGLYAQQVGYQVGDFFVQIQSGTNAFVAFGQQATQLAGLLPGLVGAILGIGISVATMFLSMWDRTRRANDDATQAADRYAEALKSMREQAATTRDELTALFAGYEGSQSGALLRRIAEREQEMQALRDTALAEIGGLSSGRGGATAQAARDIRAGQLREEMESQLRLMEQQNAADREALETARQQVIVQQQLNAVTDRIQDLSTENDLVAAQLVYMRQGVEIEEARNRAQEDVLLRQAMALADSTSATEEQRVAAARFVEQLVDGVNRARELKAEMNNVGTEAERARRIAEGISRQIGTAADAALRLRDAMASVGTASLGRLEQAALLRAQISAAQRGLSVPGAEAAAETALRLSRAGATADQIAAEAERARREAETVDTLRQQLSLLTSPASGSSGSSGGGAVAEDFIAQRTRELEVERQLLTTAESLRREREIYFQLQEQYAGTSLGADDRALQQMAAELAQRERINDTLREQQRLQQSIVSGIAGALVAGLTAAENRTEAMRNALRGLANQLVDVFTQRIFAQLFGDTIFSGAGGGGLLRGLLPSANGNVFSGSPSLSAYSGQVVSQPTVFAFARGAGVMGEAGPEAIMPLKRGRDGKLGVAGAGGGSGTVINIENYTGQQVKEQRSRGPNGQELVTIAVGEAVGRGKLDKQMRGRYGVRPERMIR